MIILHNEGTSKKKKSLSHQIFQEELLSMKLIFLMNVKLQINSTLSLQTSGVNWQVKFLFQQPSNPTQANQILSWKQNNCR